MDKHLVNQSPQLAYSLKEAARIIGLGDRKFHQEVLDGKIDVVKIGKRRLVTPSAIKTYLDKNTVKAFDASTEAKRILESKGSSFGRKQNARANKK